MSARRTGLLTSFIGIIVLAFALLAPTQAQAVEPVYNATLKADHVGATNPGFQAETCPSAGWGWHFVTQGSTTDFVAVKATFLNAGVITTFVSFPTAKHAYVYTPSADTLLSAVAQVSGPDLEFNLSHVCTGSTTTTSVSTSSTTTTEATTTTTEPTTTTTEPTTTTTEATTTTTEATTTTTEATTTTTEATTTTSTTEPPQVLDTTTTAPTASTSTTEPGGVQNVGQDRTPPNVGSGTLARTGRDVRALVLLGASLVLFGAVLVRRSQLRMS